MQNNIHICVIVYQHYQCYHTNLQKQNKTMQLFSSSHWHFLTQNPPVLLHTDGPVQQDLQPGVQLQLAVQTPCPGLLELLGCRDEVIVLGTLSLAAQMVLQRFVWPPLICERLQQLQHLQHHRQDLQMQKKNLPNSKFLMVKKLTWLMFSDNHGCFQALHCHHFEMSQRAGPPSALFLNRPNIWKVQLN